MTLRIATWNVNSVRKRMAGLARFCAEVGPDVVCLQEIKAREEDFPFEPLRALGYKHQIVQGQKAYNGVAIVSRLPFEAEGARRWCAKDDRRHAFVRLPGGIELHNFYVPSGGPVPDPEANDKFDHKLRFLKEMARWCRRESVKDRRLILLGDLNVAPLETDVWNHQRLLRSVGHTPVESEHMAKLLKAGGFIDAERHFVPPSEPLYTWWGYRFAQAYEKNYGWRLDHVWVTERVRPQMARLRIVDETRRWETPSDHVPVVLDLD
jgi:exodeoxyribonuclease-3